MTEASNSRADDLTPHPDSDAASRARLVAGDQVDRLGYLRLSGHVPHSPDTPHCWARSPSMPAPDLPTDPDELAAVTSTAQFGAALQRLRKAAGWSLRELQKRTEREVERQPKSGHVVLAKSTVADVEGGKVLPRLEWLTCYLTVCRLPTREQRPWLRTRARLVVGPALVTTSPLRWQHVADCDPHALGVHPSITTAPAVGHPDRAMVPLSPLSPLPQWVPRDVEDQVRDAVVTAAGQAGLVVLVGGSSTG